LYSFTNSIYNVSVKISGRQNIMIQIVFIYNPTPKTNKNQTFCMW